MRVRFPVIVLLLLSLFFATQVRPQARPVEMTKGVCAGMRCMEHCCANMACCTVAQQQQAPQPETSASLKADLQLATLGLRDFPLLYLLPCPMPSFALRDEAPAAHALPTRAVTCIRLI